MKIGKKSRENGSNRNSCTIKSREYSRKNRISPRRKMKIESKSLEPILIASIFSVVFVYDISGFSLNC